MRVAQGASYRTAARESRSASKRLSNQGRYRRRDPDLDGQLVANWVDVFTSTIADSLLPAEWPERLAVDCRGFRIGGVLGASFYVFIAVGYDAPHYGARPWLMRTYPNKNATSWRNFFDQLEGTPERIVADFDRAIERGAQAAFPRPGDPAPNYLICEHHAHQVMIRWLSALRGQPQHPLFALEERALMNAAEWQAFEQAIRHEDATGTPLPLAINGLARYGPRLSAQAAARRWAGPHSTGAVEAIGDQLAHSLLGERARTLGNRERTNKLLQLLTIGLREPAISEASWAAKIRRDLEQRQGRTSFQQRPHDDPRGRPSLV
jgi:hypothetical protein